MYDNTQPKHYLDDGLTSGQEVVLNVIVNKNIVIVQFQTGNEGNYHSDVPIVTCRTKFSINFGKDWKEITLSSDGLSQEDFHKFPDDTDGYINNSNIVGGNGCLIDFIVRRGDGTRFYMYTPIYYRPVQHNGNGIFVSYPNLMVMGYLVNDETGKAINTTARNPLREFPTLKSREDKENMESMFTFYDCGANPQTGKFTPSLNHNVVYDSTFIAYPYNPIFHSNTSSSTDDLKLVNRVDTVDYTHNGNRYTIVKRLATVYIRRGNLTAYWDYDLEIPTPAMISDHYILVLPFIYVYDHKSFSRGETNLVWIDFLNLTEKLASLRGSLRPSAETARFVKSLFTDDLDFQTETGNANTYYSGTDTVGLPGALVQNETNLVLERMPYGELLKITDKVTKKEILGFLFGNRRYVCVGDPTVTANWVQGETKTEHLHPTKKEAFTYKLAYAEGYSDLSNDPKAKLVTYERKYDYEDEIPSNESVDNEEIYTDLVFYRKFNVFGSTNPPLRIDVAGDRVVAIPDMSSGDLLYKFACFIKDPVNNNYTIGFKSESMRGGYSALVDNAYSLSNPQPYPVRVSSISGALYDTSTFIMTGVVNNFSDPFTVSPNSVIPTTVIVDGDSGPVDLDTYTLIATECIGFDLISTYRHPTNNSIRRVVTQNQSAGCGYTNDGNQMPIMITLGIIKDIPMAWTKNGSPYGVGHRGNVFNINCVLTGDGRLILRPRLSDIVSPSNPNDVTMGFDIAQSTQKLTIAFTDPSVVGLNNSRATHDIFIGQDTTITLDKNYTLTSNGGTAAYAAAKTYNELSVGNEGGLAFVTTHAYISGNDVVFVLDTYDTGIPGWTIGNFPTLIMADDSTYRNPNNTAVFPFNKVMGAKKLVYKLT